jgi:hypothetical protein
MHFYNVCSIYSGVMYIYQSLSHFLNTSPLFFKEKAHFLNGIHIVQCTHHFIHPFVHFAWVYIIQPGSHNTQSLPNYTPSLSCNMVSPFVMHSTLMNFIYASAINHDITKVMGQ